MKPIDPVIQRFLKQLYKRGYGQLHQLDKAQILKFLKITEPTKVPFKGKSFQCPTGCIVRQYSPEVNPHLPRRALIYLPANGYFINRVNFNNAICNYLANELNLHVLAIYQPLAPECLLPYSTLKVFNCILKLYQHAGSHHLEKQNWIIWGESSGANITLACTHLFNTAGLNPFNQQVVFYPMVDLVTPYPSKHLYRDGFGMDASFIEWMQDQALNKQQDRSHPLISPIFQTQFNELPNATVVIAGYDYFKDEGLAYAQKLRNHNVPVNTIIASEMIHGFLRFFPRHPNVLKLVQDVCEYLKRSSILL